MSRYSVAVLALGPVMYWRFDETSGTTAADASGNFNTGTYTISAAVPILNQASLINDPSPSVNMNGGQVVGVFNPYVQGASQTFIGWAMFPPSITVGTFFFSTGGASTPFLQASSTTQQFTWAAAANGTQILLSTPVPTSIFFWAAVVTPTQTELFINGASRGTFASGSNSYTTPGFFIAGQWWDRMDEVAIFPTALAPAQLASLYQIATTSAPPPLVASAFVRRP